MDMTATGRRVQAADQPGSDGRPDWRRDEAYRALLECEPMALAWEWLRRNRNYRSDSVASGCRGPAAGVPHPGAWGLCAYCDPDLPFGSARPTWDHKACPFVLPITATRGSGAGTLALGALLGRTLTIAAGRDGTEHCLFTGRSGSLRFDVVEGSIADGPFVPRFLLEGSGAAGLLLPLVAQFLQMAESGDVRPAPRPLQWRRRRILELRTSDALARDASQREIAAILIDADARLPGWRLGLSSIRSRAQRLVRAARQMENGGWAALLDRRGVGTAMMAGSVPGIGACRASGKPRGC